MNNTEYILEAKNIKKNFVSDNLELSVLNELNLKLKKATSLAIIGSSGSGKSTLLYTLGGLEKPNSGAVYFNNEDIFNKNENQLAFWRNKSIGFVFQFHHLLSDFTALENAAMPARLSGINAEEAENRAEEILNRVGLAKRLKHRPGALSGGEQQRVAIARALVMEPDIFLADEPTGNLDFKIGAEVNNLILELVSEKKVTAVIVTHNLSLAKLLDKQLELKNGKLSEINN